MAMEPLEERRLLTVSATYYNDNWAPVTDNAPEGLSVGDIVNNGNDGGDGSISGKYGIDAFGRVNGPGQLAGSDMIADAIAATSSPGTITVLHVPVTGVGGSISLSDPDQVLSLGSAPQTVTLINGSLTLSAGTLSVGIDNTGRSGAIALSNGTVNLGVGASLSVLFGDNGAITGTKYVIINNDSTDAINGQFDGLPQGATFQAGERTFSISYAGGDGNDVELTLTSQMNPFTSFVNDNWYDRNTNVGTLNAGDTVDDRNDVGGTGNVVRTFEQAALDPQGFQSAAYDDIQQAVNATAPGGAVTILPGAYSAGVTGQVVVSKPLVIQGEFTLTGSLIADNAPLTLITGTGIGTIGVTNLTLSSTSKLLMSGLSTGSDQINVSGDVDLGGAALTWQWVGDATNDVILIDNQGANPVTGTFAGLPEGAEILVNGQKFWITYSGGDGNNVELVIPDGSSVVARQLFYEHSRYDGNTTGVNTSDDAAIAPDKSALLPGTTATFDNVSSYTKGINGIMVDIAGSQPHPNITADDLFFEVGSALNQPATSWTTAPAPATVSVRAGAGTSGSDRVEIIWADGVIKNEWLKVTVLSTIDTGLAAPDVFYFGSRVGDSGLGDIASSAITNAYDQAAVRANLTPAGFWEPITNIYDYDRTGRVNSGDESAARLNPGSLHLSAPLAPPSVGQLIGTTTWTPGTDVTLAATAPTLPDGTLDPSILGIDFYQDVNGNGILDQGDELMANGTAVDDDSGNHMGWKGTFDPADLLPGRASILAVPRNVDGPIGASRYFSGFAYRANNTTLGVPNVNLTVTASAVGSTATASANLNGGPNVYEITSNVVAVPGAGATLAFSAAVGGFSISDEESSAVANSAGLGYTNVVGGRSGEIIAQASTSAGATSHGPNAEPFANGIAGFIGAVTYVVTSPGAPIGAPVVITRDVLAFGFVNATGDNAGANATMNAGNVGALVLPRGTPLTFVSTQAVLVGVGAVITINYEAPGGLANRSAAGADPAAPNFPAESSEAAGLQFLKIKFN